MRLKLMLFVCSRRIGGYFSWQEMHLVSERFPSGLRC